MTFSNSPIVEATFHISLQHDPSFDVDILDAYKEAMKSEFPNIKQKRSIENSINFTNPDDIVSLLNSNKEGYFLVTSDDKKVIQATLSGFSFSKLKSYDTWDLFFTEAFSLWEKYISLTSVNKVSRLALHYLNNILIPFQESIQLQDYINIFPEVPENLEMTISEYFMQVSLSSQKYNLAQSIVTQSVTKDTNINNQNLVPINLNIEVFQDVNLNPNDAIIKNIFNNTLRHFKNDIFYNSITDKSRGLFQ